MSSSLDYQLVTKLNESDASAAWLGRKLDSGANALVRVFHGTLWHRPDPRGHFVDRAEALQAIAEGTIVGGMIPKVEESLAMLEQGIEAIHIVGVEPPSALLDEARQPGSRGTAFVR